jgi:ATP-binding cassette, subfamily B (MDR/TAP), member 1
MSTGPNNDQPSLANSNAEVESKDEKESPSNRSIEPGADSAAVNTLSSIQPEPRDVGSALQKLDSALVEKKDLDQDPFGHLPAHEADILRRQVETPDVKVGYFTLFSHADALDWIIFTIAVICAVVAGAAMPLMTVSSVHCKLSLISDCCRWFLVT